MRDGLEVIQQHFERKGVPMSQGKVVRSILIPGIESALDSILADRKLSSSSARPLDSRPAQAPPSPSSVLGSDSRATEETTVEARQ